MATEKRWKREDPEKIRARQARFHKDRMVQVNLALNDRTDADIIAFLETVPSKRGFILEAIRAAMAAEKELSHEEGSH